MKIFGAMVLIYLSYVVGMRLLAAAVPLAVMGSIGFAVGEAIRPGVGVYAAIALPVLSLFPKS